MKSLMVILDIRKHNTSRENKYFLDTNVWMHLFSPTAKYPDKHSPPYIAFYDKARREGAKVYVATMVISEFVNSCLRLDCEAQGISRKNYKKTYRLSRPYFKMMEAMRHIVINKILIKSEILNDNMNKMSFNTVFSDANRTDFNDAYFSNLIKGKDIILVTNDGDFHHLANNHTILTANRNLLRSYRDKGK